MSSSSAPRSILVTGGGGFIGSHLVDRLLAQGDRVVVIDDFSTGRRENLVNALRSPSFQLIEGKVSALPDLEKWVGRSQQVFHLAAAVGVELVVNSPVRTIETNLRETEAILAAASAHRTPVLLASTSEVYGRSQRAAFAETDDLVIGPPHIGRWSYACSKLMDEFLSLAYHAERGVPVIIARLFNTVGPRQTGKHGMVLPRFVLAAQRGETLRVYGDGSQMRCFCHVHDTVEALLRLASTPAARGQVVNVGRPDEISIRHLAESVIRELGSPSPIESIPYEKVFQSGFEDMRYRRPDIRKLTELTGFVPSRTLAEIIQEIAATTADA